MTPLVSVILPVYNAEKYVANTIKSILAQSLTEFELIIIDDASTDKSSKIIQTFTDERIRYHKNSTNLKLVASLNKALTLAQAPFVARIDADDLMASHRLEAQYDYLQKHQDIDILGSDFFLINAAGRVIQRRYMPSSPEDISFFLNIYCPIGHPTTMFRKEKIVSLNGYDPSEIHVEDFALWKKANNSSNIKNISEPLTYIRKHPDNITTRFQVIHQTNKLKLIERSFDLPIELLYLIKHPSDNNYRNAVLKYIKNLKSVGKVEIVADLIIFLYRQQVRSPAIWMQIFPTSIFKSKKLKSHLTSLYFLVVRKYTT